MRPGNVISIAAAFASCLILYGAFGSIHRSADTIAMLFPALAFIAMLGAFYARAVLLRVTCITLALFAAVIVGSAFLPQSSGTDLRIYSKNLWAGNDDLTATLVDITEADVDAVFLQEVSDLNKPILTALQTDFPHQHFCRFSGWSGIAVLSRLAFDGPVHCSDWRAMAAAPVRLQGERIWLISTHIPWPWPHESIESERAVRKLLETLDGKMVIGGDFNILPWSGRVGRIAKLSGTTRAGPAPSTFTFAGVPLPIDFALAPFGGSVHKRGRFGSDHAGIVANLNIWPPTK